MNSKIFYITITILILFNWIALIINIKIETNQDFINHSNLPSEKSILKSEKLFAVKSLMEGKVFSALEWQPFFVIGFSVLLFLSLFLFLDLLFQQTHLFDIYTATKKWFD